MSIEHDFDFKFFITLRTSKYVTGEKKKECDGGWLAKEFVWLFSVVIESAMFRPREVKCSLNAVAISKVSVRFSFDDLMFLCGQI